MLALCLSLLPGMALVDTAAAAAAAPEGITQGSGTEASPWRSARKRS